MATKRERNSGLTVEEAHRRLRYDADSGKFYWRIDVRCGANSRVRCAAGSEAGSITREGYGMICLNYTAFYAHRLAWFMTHGQWPDAQLDHRDLDRGNNRISNLRPATLVQNRANTAPRARSGFKGVIVPRHAPNCFVAQISINGRPKYLGTFRTAEAAHAAYAVAAKARHGEFARLV